LAGHELNHVRTNIFAATYPLDNLTPIVFSSPLFSSLYTGDMLSIKILGNPSSRAGQIYWQKDRANPNDKYTLFYWMFHAIFNHVNPKVAFLLWGLFHACFWILPAWLLWYKDIFIRV